MMVCVCVAYNLEGNTASAAFHLHLQFPHIRHQNTHNDEHMDTPAGVLML